MEWYNSNDTHEYYHCIYRYVDEAELHGKRGIILPMKKACLPLSTYTLHLGVYKTFVYLYTRIGVKPFTTCPTLDH